MKTTEGMQGMRVLAYGYADKLRRIFAALLLVVFSCGRGFSAQHHVTPAGSSGGSGSMTNPWSLEYALSHPSVVQAGDTIWMHGGVYRGNYQCQLVGSPTRPIIVRGYGRERAVIDAGLVQGLCGIVFTARSNYVWLWGLEIMSNATDRRSENLHGVGYGDTDIPSGIKGDGVGTHYGLKIINCVFHDLLTGIQWYANEQNSEIYGNIFYNIGISSGDNSGGTGYAIYAHTGSGGWQTFINNIAGNGFDYNFHLYSTSQNVDSMVVKQNILFNAARLIGDSHPYQHAGFLLGGARGGATIVSDTVEENYLWATNGSGNMRFGFERQIARSVIRNNRCFGSNTYNALSFDAGDTNLTVEGNTLLAGWERWNNQIYGRHIRIGNSYLDGFLKYPKNTFMKTYVGELVGITNAPPTAGDSTYFLPNKYEAKRGHVVSYNWAGKDSVHIKVSGTYFPGDTVRVYNAQNPYNDEPHVAVCRNDTTLTIPMNASRWSMAKPSGWSRPGTTFPTFGVFMMIRQSGDDPNPGVSVITAPKMGSTDESVTPTIRWIKASDAQRYRVRISTDSTFESVVTDSITQDTVMVAGPLESATRHFVSVQAGNAYEMGAPSQLCRFVTSVLKTDMSMVSLSLPETALLQNFPNPFNPTTTVHFALREPGFVTLTIHNMLGQEVDVLVQERLSAGMHAREWNAGALASGVYLCHMAVGQFSATTRMMVLR